VDTNRLEAADTNRLDCDHQAADTNRLEFSKHLLLDDGCRPDDSADRDGGGDGPLILEVFGLDAGPSQNRPG
jgi:hypothetical protein